MRDTKECITTKESSGYNVYAAMNGYDFAKANPMDRNGDPGIRNRIFLHDCTDGYYSFIGDIRKDMSCSSDFKMTSITTEEAYRSERGSSNDVSKSISGSVGTYNDIDLLRPTDYYVHDKKIYGKYTNTYSFES